MKKIATLLLTGAMLLTCATGVQPSASAAAATETTKTQELVKDDVPVQVMSEDGLVTLELPNQRWAELHSDEHAILFSNGDCAITIDQYKKTDTLPTIPLPDDTHKLVFTSALGADDYVLFITGYAHDEEDFAPIGKAIYSIKVNKDKISESAKKETGHSYTVRDTSYSAWVTAAALNVRSASGTDASVIASLPQNTKVTVTGEVLENNQYIGWSRIQMSNGVVGYVASQFLTSTQPQPKAQRNGNTQTLWSEYGTAYTLYEYTDGSWKSDDGTTYWATSTSTWINSAGRILYTYDPTYHPAEEPTKTGNSAQLWDSTGIDVMVYFYTDNVWRSGSGAIFWPDGFSTWGCENGRTYYDYNPAYVEPTETEPVVPDDYWKADFEESLYGHDGMIACWYTYLGDGWYEVYCQDPNNPDTNGIVHVNAYTGSWNWV